MKLNKNVQTKNYIQTLYTSCLCRKECINGKCIIEQVFHIVFRSSIQQTHTPLVLNSFIFIIAMRKLVKVPEILVFLALTDSKAG